MVPVSISVQPLAGSTPDTSFAAQSQITMNGCPPSIDAVNVSVIVLPEFCRPPPLTPIGATGSCPVSTTVLSSDCQNDELLSPFVTLTVDEPGEPDTSACQNAAWPNTVGLPLSPRSNTSLVQDCAGLLEMLGAGTVVVNVFPAHSARNSGESGGVKLAVVAVCDAFATAPAGVDASMTNATYAPSPVYVPAIAFQLF
jgi:hypothetical protein